MKKKKIVVAIPPEEEFISSFARWGQDYDWDNKDVHFVHVVKKNIHFQLVGEREVPDEETFNKNKDRIDKYLESVSKKIMKHDKTNSVEFSTFLSASPVEDLADFLLKTQADLVVVATRKKAGLEKIYLSSFADSLIKVSPCDVLILRP